MTAQFFLKKRKAGETGRKNSIFFLQELKVMREFSCINNVQQLKKFPLVFKHLVPSLIRLFLRANFIGIAKKG